jgi:hypothetical protein
MDADCGVDVLLITVIVPADPGAGETNFGY